MPIPQTIKDLANKVRTAIYGADVRESIAKSMEVTGDTADIAKKTADEQLDRVDRLIRENPQPSEVVDARGGEPLLKYRLDKTDQKITQNYDQVTSQLAVNEAQLLESANKQATESINIKFPPKPLLAAIGDGESHTIRDVFPSVTLSQVQALNTSATLDNQADWYAIQTLFNYAYNNGKSIYIPAGTYRIDLPLKYRPYAKINGVGVKSKFDSYVKDGYTFMFDKDNEVLGPHGVAITNIFISGTNHTGTGGGLSVTSSGHGMVIEKCWINNFSKTDQIGVYGYGDLYYLTIKECNIQKNYIGIKFDGTGAGVNNCGIENCKITTGATGISLLYAPNTLIKNCQVEQFTIGIDVQSNYCKIDTCWLEQNSIADIRFKSCRLSVAENLYTYRTTTHAGQYSIKFELANRCGVKDSYFNNRVGANKPIFFDIATQCFVDNCGMDDSSNVYHDGTLGSNIVRSFITTGILNRTEIPQQFYGGIWLDTATPSNVQDGVMYRNNVGLVFRQNSADNYLSASAYKEYYRSTMPTSATFNAQEIVWNTNKIEVGSTGNKYIILGWLRLTTGSGHVLNTDWKEMRVLTGN